MLWMRLALAMGRTVAELQAILTAGEFVEWMAFYELEPFGPRQEDYRAGTICEIVATGGGVKRKDGRQLRPGDFFPRSPLGDDPEETREAQERHAELQRALAKIAAQKAAQA